MGSEYLIFKHPNKINDTDPIDKMRTDDTTES